MALTARPLIDGSATGIVLRSPRALSFWGGVDPRSGIVTDTQSDLRGHSIEGRILVLPTTRGSSSSSSVMLELIHARRAPAAIIVGQADAIIGIGILAAQEIDLAPIPLFELPASQHMRLSNGTVVSLASGGRIAFPQGIS